MITIDYSDITLLSEVAKQLLHYGKNYRIWAFYGEMGTGKTTVISALVKELKVLHEASSPTFAIINEYPTEAGNSIYHIDLYRIRNVAELYEIGLEEYLDSGNYVFIEWPEIAEPLLQYYTVLKSKLIVNEQGNRQAIIFV